jgi:cobalt/nickel transport system permease protein
VLGVLAYVVVVVATPLDRWHLLAMEGLALAFLVGLSGLEPGALLRRWLGFFLLFGFLSVVVATGHPRRADLGAPAVAAAILVKNSLAFGAVVALAEIVPFPQLLGALGRLGVPAVLVATLHFLYRYLHVLAEEVTRMSQARRARTFRRSGRLDWVRLGGLIGMLFVRTLERGERVHAAMLARGWDGTLRSLDGDGS